MRRKGDIGRLVLAVAALIFPSSSSVPAQNRANVEKWRPKDGISMTPGKNFDQQ